MAQRAGQRALPYREDTEPGTRDTTTNEGTGKGETTRVWDIWGKELGWFIVLCKAPWGNFPFQPRWRLYSIFFQGKALGIALRDSKDSTPRHTGSRQGLIPQPQTLQRLFQKGLNGMNC